MRNSIVLVAVVAILGGAAACSSTVNNIYETPDASSAVDARAGVGDPSPDGGDASDPTEAATDSALDAGADPLDAADGSWWSENCAPWEFQDAAAPDADFTTSADCVVVGSCNDVCANVRYLCPAGPQGQAVEIPAGRECLHDPGSATTQPPVALLEDDAGHFAYWSTQCCYGADE